MGIETLFEGHELSEEFKAKATTVFEAAVIEAVAQRESVLNKEIETIKEQFAQTEQSLRTESEARITELMEKANQYGSFIASSFEEKLQNESEKYQEYVSSYVNETVVQKVDAFLDYV